MFVEGERKISRKQVLDKAYRVSACIRQRHLKCSRFIPIVLPNCNDYFAAELGIWMSGNASVHLGECFPVERVEYIAEDCDAPFIVDRSYMDNAMKCEPDYRIQKRSPEQDCVMFYTSGSTGNPKGVLHSDKGFLEGILRSNNYRCVEDDVFGSVSPFYFIAGNSIHKCAAIGMTIDIIDEQTYMNFDALKDHIKAHNITITFMSPSMLGAYDISGLGLHLVRTGSERVSNVYSPGPCIISNGYGQTESAGGTLTFDIDKPYDNTPVGKPAPGLEALIVDEDGNMVRQGEEGELCFRGVTPCKYYKDPEKTAELMRGGIFHTGDLFRQLPSGDYLFVNRKDWMVKVNGQRVEPGEVESAIRHIDGVKDVVVKGFDGRNNSQYLCAFYTSDKELGSDTIREKLAQSLPSYMVPLYFVKLEKFPLNANGKLNRKALKSPDTDSLKAEYAAPSNDVEAALCNAFAMVLNEEKIGINDDFFRLGGDSIKVMAIQKACPSMYVTAKMIYKGRTPAQIAALVRSAGQKKPVAGDRKDFSLSTIQSFYYSFCTAREGKAVFNIPNLYKLDESVDLERLASAITRTVAIHQAFGTHLFVNSEGEVRQKYVDPEYEQIVETLTDAEFETESRRLIQPFRLLEDKLFRFRLFRTETSKYLFYDIHHIIFDGFSSNILQECISALYDGVDVRPMQWNVLELQDENAGLRRGDAFEEAKKWYDHAFAGAPSEVYPAPDRNAQFSEMELISRSIDVSQESMRSLCDREHITMNVLVSAAAGCLIGRYCNTTDSLLKTMYHAREDMRSQRLVGSFAVPLMMRMKWEESDSISDYLQNASRHIMGGMSHCVCYSSADLRDNQGVRNAMPFIFQGDSHSDGFRIGETVAVPVPVYGSEHSSPVNVHVSLNATDGLDVRIFYLKNLYSPGFIEGFINNFAFVLNGMLREGKMSGIQLSDFEK